MKSLYNDIRLYKKLIILVASLVVTNNMCGQGLKVKVNNKTNQDIDSLKIGLVYVGHIPKDSSTQFINFSKFYFDSGHPYESISGQILKETLTEWHWSDCASERRNETTGTFVFDLEVIKRENKNYLGLKHSKNCKSD